MSSVSRVSKIEDLAKKEVLYKNGSPSNSTVYARTPVVITCVRWLAEKQKKFIALNINPKSISFSPKRRGVSQKTYGGSIRHATPRNRFAMHGNMDEFEAAFTFQTGNIIPVYLPNGELQNGDRLSVGGNPNIPHGLNALHMLFELLDENVIFAGKPNYHMVFLSSKLTPSIALQGFFQTDGPSMEESAGDGVSSKEYTMNLEVLSITPSFRSAAELSETWLRASSDYKNRPVTGTLVNDTPFNNIA